ADVLHPVHVHPRVALRMESDAPVANGLDGGLCELLHPYEPLKRDQRLDPLAGALGERNRVAVLLLAGDQALLAELGDHGLARLAHGHSGEALGSLARDPSILADHADLVEAVAAPDLEVVGIVTGSDL